MYPFHYHVITRVPKSGLSCLCQQSRDTPYGLDIVAIPIAVHAKEKRLRAIDFMVWFRVFRPSITFSSKLQFPRIPGKKVV
jgi:hypothetical protein